MHHTDKFICVWSWIVALIVLGKHMSMDLLHPKIFTDIVSLSKLYLLVTCIVAPCSWFVIKLLQLLRHMVCSSFEAAHASFMIPPPTESDPLDVASSHHEESFTSPPQQNEDDDRHVYWMDQSLDTLDGMGAIVYTTDEVPRGEGRDIAWQSVRERVLPNYRKHWRAQKALANLIPIYEDAMSMRDHPHRFGSGSSYEKRLSECKLYEQGLDMIFLEMQLRIEFRPTSLSNLVRGTWEEAAFDQVCNERIEDLDDSGVVEGGEEEKGDVPAEEIVASATIVGEVEEELIEEEIIFDQPVVEEEEVDLPAMEGEEESVVEEIATAAGAEEEVEGGVDVPVEVTVGRKSSIDFDQLFDQIFSGPTENAKEAESRKDDAHAVVSRVHWSDKDFAHRRFRPFSESGHTISSKVYFKCPVQRTRLEEHTRHYGCVLDELSGLTKVQYFDLDTESDEVDTVEAAREESVEQQDNNFEHQSYRVKRELASLECGLGKYWLSSTSERQGRLRRSGRKTRAPVRYSP